MELSERENAIIHDFGRGAEGGDVAYSNDLSVDELEGALLGILGKLRSGAMKCVLGEPAPEMAEAVVETRELTPV